MRCEVADCRSMPVVPDGAASVLVDKGTLDALHGDEDKMAMLRECMRCLSPDGGVIVSVSFPAADRIRLLDEATSAFGIQHRTRVIADGDPAHGHKAVFVTVLGRDLDDAMRERAGEKGDERDELSEMLLARVRRSGSLLEDEPPG